MNNQTLIASWMLLLVAIFGCDPSPENSGEATSNAEQISTVDQVVDAGSAESEDAPATNQLDSVTASVELELASWEDVEKEIQASEKPVIVDVWSTSCLPCMKEFPGLVEIHKAMGDQIRCISVNVDYIGLKSTPPEDYREDVLAFLQSQNATLTNYLCTTADRDVYEKLSLESIPAVYIYAADGSLAKRFVDADFEAGFTYEKDVRPFVDQMLKGQQK